MTTTSRVASLPRPRLATVFGVVLLIVVIWAIFAAIQGLAARSALENAETALRSVEQSVTVEAVLDGTASSDLAEARDALATADDELGARVLSPIRVLPVLGRQLTSARALSGAGLTVLDAAIDASDDAQLLLDGVLARDDRSAALRELENIFRAAHVEVTSVDLGPSEGLIGPIRSARSDLVDDLASAAEQLDRGAEVTAGLADFLDGPRRYLLGAANNAEMRAGQGAVLSAGLLLAQDGAIIATEMKPVWDRVVTEPVAISDVDLEARWGWLIDGQEWLLTSMSPRLDATAPLLADMWVASGEPEVDGVIVVDPFALRALLRAVGPVEAGGRTIGSEEVLDLLLHEQYLDVQFGDSDQFARRERLSDIAPAVLQAFFERDVDLSTLVRELDAVVRGRHLMAWSSGPDARLWEAAGADGGLDDDSMLLSVINRGPNKLDYFQYVDSTVEVTPDGDGWSVRVTSTIVNRTPDGLPRYVAGPILDSPTPRSWYRGIVTLNIPGSATNGRIDGVESLTVVGADGATRVLGTEILVAPDDVATVVFEFDLPSSVASFMIEPSARFPLETWTTPGGARVETGLGFEVELIQ